MNKKTAECHVNTNDHDIWIISLIPSIPKTIPKSWLILSPNQLLFVSIETYFHVHFWTLLRLYIIVFNSARDIYIYIHDVISESSVLSWLHCAINCLEKRFCAAFNFKENSNKNYINCQLTHNAEHKFKRLSKEETDWTFYDVYGERMVKLFRT